MLKRSFELGFSLIEAAIVLAIVGLVIGGIWVAAATVKENHKASRTVTGILSGCGRAAEVFSKGTGVFAGANEQDRTTLARQTKIVPPDWIDGTNIVSPYGGKVYVSEYPLGWDEAAIAANGGAFDPSWSLGVHNGNTAFYLTGLTQNNCIKILQNMRVGSKGIIFGLWRARGAAATFGDWSLITGMEYDVLFPATQTVTQLCPTGSQIVLELYCATPR